MSVHRLQLEQELRQAEVELRLVREGELRAAEAERLALLDPLPASRKVYRVLDGDPEQAASNAAATRIERWWKSRRRGLLPTDSEIARLVRFIRRGNRK